MREIQAQQITDVVERLCIEANEQLPGDIKDAIRRCRACEDWEIAQGVLDKIITNFEIAGEERVPICQDTGMACVFLEIGQDVHIAGGDLREAVDEGVRSKEEPWCSFNLSDKNHRKILEQKLREEKINFLILDNITCLVGDKGIISEKIAQEVMTWATELSNDISILIIHHTNEEKNKISGSDIWRRRCTNELQLIGKKDLETLPDLPEEIKNIAHSCDGAFFGMRCNSSKSCSILKDKIIWASLPLGASKWNLHAVTDEYGKVLKDLSLEHHEEILPENTTPMNPDPTELPKLSDYDKIYNKFGFESFSRPDIDELFDCEKDKSHKIIEKLGAKIEKTGNGNQTRYKLSPQN